MRAKPCSNFTCQGCWEYNQEKFKTQLFCVHIKASFGYFFFFQFCIKQEFDWWFGNYFILYSIMVAEKRAVLLDDFICSSFLNQIFCIDFVDVFIASLLLIGANQYDIFCWLQVCMFVIINYFASIYTKNLRFD